LIYEIGLLLAGILFDALCPEVQLCPGNGTWLVTNLPRDSVLFGSSIEVEHSAGIGD